MIDTDKYEGHTPAPWMNLGSDANSLLMQDAPLLLAEVKRLRLLFRELINDMSADEYIEWCDRIGCPDGLEVEAIE